MVLTGIVKGMESVMNNKGEMTFIECIITFMIIILLTLLVGTPFFTCGVESRLYNEKFHTNYTAKDFFFAGDTIKTMLNGGQQDTHNYNINGAIPVWIQK